jgi:hypothetical protein
LLTETDGAAKLADEEVADEEVEADEDDPLPFQTSSPIGVSRMSASIASAESTQRLRPFKSFMLSL